MMSPFILKTKSLHSVFYLLFCAVFSFFVSFSLSDKSLLSLIIVFGQAHFVVSYIYTFFSGKMDHFYRVKFFLLLLFFGFISFLTHSGFMGYNFLIITTSLLFVIHYWLDENKISNFSFQSFFEKNTLLILTTISFGLFFFHTLGVFNLIPYVPFYIVFLIILLLFKTFFARFFSVKISKNTSFFHLSNIFIPPLCLLYEGVTVYNLLAFIILFHYLRWYIFYFTMKQGSEREGYLSLVSLVHIFVFLSYFIYSLSSGSLFLFIFFDPAYFYMWTLIHIILSLRKKEYEYS